MHPYRYIIIEGLRWNNIIFDLSYFFYIESIPDLSLYLPYMTFNLLFIRYLYVKLRDRYVQYIHFLGIKRQKSQNTVRTSSEPRARVKNRQLLFAHRPPPIFRRSRFAWSNPTGKIGSRIRNSHASAAQYFPEHYLPNPTL